MFVSKIKNYIFNKFLKWLKMDEELDVFQLVYHMKSGFATRYFAYTRFVEDYKLNELEFTNEMTGEILTICKDDLSDYKTKPLRIYDN